jgi:sugar/nucleoside kinase (ribokinase family)
MKRFDVLGLGVSTVDALYLVDHLPSDEGNQRALAMSLQGGGPVATAIVALARLGMKTAMADTVGDDWRGDLIRRSFADEGVSTEELETHTGCTSTLSCVLVRQQDGARSIVWYPGTAPELAPSDRLRKAVAATQIVHLNGRHFEACMAACRWAHEAGGRISFDGGAHRYRDELRRLVPQTDICIVARQFAQAYTGEPDAARAAERLLQEGPSLVVVTDGASGSWVHPRDESPFAQAAFTIQDIVDTTGCGDSFHGAFVYGVLKGMRLRQTARFASAVAALNTRALGGRDGLPALEQVTAFLQQQ